MLVDKTLPQGPERDKALKSLADWTVEQGHSGTPYTYKAYLKELESENEYQEHKKDSEKYSKQREEEKRKADERYYADRRSEKLEKTSKEKREIEAQERARRIRDEKLDAEMDVKLGLRSQTTEPRKNIGDWERDNNMMRSGG